MYGGKGLQKMLLVTSLHSCDQRAPAFAEAYLVFGPAQRTSRFLQNFFFLHNFLMCCVVV